MDSVQYLLKFLSKLAIVVFFAAIVWWGVVTFSPGINPHSILASIGLKTPTSVGGEDQSFADLLPSPRNVGGLFGKAKTPSAEDNVYKGGEVYNGYANAFNGNKGGASVNFVTYTEQGEKITHVDGTPVFNTNGEATTNTNTMQAKTAIGYAPKELYIRNLSIYERGYVYTGLTFVGEARSTMFQNGHFPVVIVDAQGKVLSVNYAEATSDWTVAGWAKFGIRINGSLPNNIPCTMVFEQARVSGSQAVPTRIAIPIQCH
jgi:hypothetical protein